MKKAVFLILVLALTLSLTACVSDELQNEPEANEPTDTPSEIIETEPIFWQVEQQSDITEHETVPDEQQKQEYLLSLAETYDIDYEMLTVISIKEGNFTLHKDNNEFYADTDIISIDDDKIVLETELYFKGESWLPINAVVIFEKADNEWTRTVKSGFIDILIESNKFLLNEFELIGGYYIDENGDIYLDNSNWVKCDFETYKQYFFGEWEHHIGRDIFIIDDNNMPDEMYIYGDNTIIEIRINQWGLDLDTINWININNPNIIIGDYGREYSVFGIRMFNLYGTFISGHIGNGYHRVTKES